MGVRGLTTFIEKNKELYMKRHKLRDSHLVIDGYSLCAQLYGRYAKCNDIFGGDYDKFGRCIEHFFLLLKQCNITPIVVLDGGYETRKIKTVYSRLRNKLKTIKNINPVAAEGATIFPLFHREVFKDIILKIGVALVRCDYEADLEIACIARKLNCPVLSYDSDFFIFDVHYIPFLTLDCHITKINDGLGSKNCLICKMYNIEHFLKRCHLTKSHLPLLATLLGNDYIRKSVFKKFFSQLKLPKKNGSRSDQYRLILALIEWLKNESFETAVHKVLSRLKHRKRVQVAKKIENVTEGYACANSALFHYLGIEMSPEDTRQTIKIATEDIESDSEELESSSEEESESEEKSESEEDSESQDNQIEVKPSTIPDSKWFQSNYRKGDFPTLFIDILCLRTCIYLPQIEDSTTLKVYQISLPLVLAIAKMLLQDTHHKKFKYLARDAFAHIKKYHYFLPNIKLPKLNEIEHLKPEQSKNILLNILEMSEIDLKLIETFPKQWQLYLISLIYSARKSELNACHIYAIILCLINLNIIDKKTTAIRLKTVFLKKYETKLNHLVQETKEIQTNSIDKLIKTIKIEDCIVFINAFVSNFAMDEKLTSNWRLFSISIVDIFAQFQSCLLHIRHLNALLNYPFISPDICEFYNGTFLYNVYANFEKRNDINAYLQLILNKSPLLLHIFKLVIENLKSLIELTPVTNVKKRNRKRKKKAKIVDEVEQEQSESEEDALYDENNMFSVLSLRI